MALIVIVTQNCRDEARLHGLWGEVESFRDRVEKSQSLSLFDPFPPPYFVKKKLGGRQGRLIADRRTVGDHAVIVFLSVLTRGSRNYDNEFSRDPLAYGRQHFSDLLSDDDLIRFVDERTRKSPPPIKPDPTAAEFEVLYGAFAHHHHSKAEDIVCETQEWVERVAQERISKQLVVLCAPCLEALNRDPGLHFVQATGKQGWGVWALRTEGRLLLITPATESTTDEAEQLAKKVSTQLDGKDATTVLRSSRRAYPALILADDDLWIDLEKEPVANMALSPEETEVLESARGSDYPFPLFINGRAGSGKSTILQYLFADLLFYYLSNPEARVMAPPIYLTASGELLRVARSFVDRLLRSEATFTQQSLLDVVEDQSSVLSDAFREFQPHLLSLVPTEERLKRFASSNRVDYARFRRMWMDRFGKDKPALRDFGPDLSWHVIRSYIKGKSSETYLEPEDYAQLPENQITVTRDRFRLVYDRVWMGWYERVLETEGLWDDQDLTRYILDNDLAKPGYPAVFCDEAQDFTRLELELLLRLNLFSNRTLRPNDISRVPFAFAGDQFQTLNPTGFRWDTIKASFVEKFIFELDPARRSGRTDLNYRELKYNYRSTHKIVRFGNHVQAMRAALFQSSDLRPQSPWTTDVHSFPVVWFRTDDANFWKRFHENSGYVLVVPCNEGEEVDFVQHDSVLQEHIRTEDGVPLNVLSAARAKGCEYPAVIVYGFGSAAQFDVVSTLESESNPLAFDQDKSLPIQYFINRLYVAVSRAKRRLVVVDSDKGFARLWKCAQEELSENLMLQKVKNGVRDWSHEIEGMTIGNPDDLTRESAGDPLENARGFEADGLARHDSFLLRQAAQAYRSAGDLPKYRECRARALETEGQFFEAGDAYFDAGFAVPDGVRCLWCAGRKGWTLLLDKLAHAPQIQRELEFQWALGIIEKADATKAVPLLNRFVIRLDDPRFMETSAGDHVWREALSLLLQPLLEADPPAVTNEHLIQLVSYLDRIRAKGLRVPPLQSARIYFLSRRYADAIGLWDEARAKPIEYLRAKASVEPYPQRILSLSKLGLAGEIVEAYSAARETALTPEQASAVIDALGTSMHLVEAFNLAWEQELAIHMLRLSVIALRKVGDKVLASSALRAGFFLYAIQDHLEKVAAFASSLDFVPEPEWKSSDLVEFVRSQADAMQVTLVRALAHSEKLPDAPTHLQRSLSDFLRRYLRAKESGWRAHITVFEAGAAIERAGRFIDAIVFYEAVTRDGFSDVEKEFARRRWLVSKQRQLSYERMQGATRKVAEVERELRQEQAALGLKTLDELPRFPELPPLEKPSAAVEAPRVMPSQASTVATPAESPRKEEGTQSKDSLIMAGPFKVELSRKNSRCNITQTETMETAFVKISERKCGGEVVFNQIDDTRWVCEAWQLIVEFSSLSEQILSIHLKDFGLKLGIQL